MREKALIFLSIVLAGLFIGGAYLYRKTSADGSTDSKGRPPHEETGGPEETRREKPTPGQEGSEHSHASFLFFIEEEVLDFADPHYMLRDKLAHFENGDGVTIHKHSAGITLPYFFSTLGIQLAHTCVKLDTGQRYCIDGSKKILLFVNGKEISDFDTYEIQDKDKVLLNYGADSAARLRLKMNYIPEVPEEFQKLF